MEDIDLLNPTSLNIILRCNDNISFPAFDLLKAELEANQFIDFYNSHTLLHYYKLDSGIDRSIAEYESESSTVPNSPMETRRQSFDTPITINFTNTSRSHTCQIEYYRNDFAGILFYDFKERSSELNLSLLLEEIDTFIQSEPNLYIYQALIMIDSINLDEFKRSGTVIRHLLGRSSIVFVPDIKTATYTIFDTVLYLCEVFRLELKKLKANANEDIKTPYDIKQNFSNVPLKLWVGKKWIYSNGRNRKRMADLNLLLGKNLISLELYQQSLSASKHTGDKLFRALSQFGIAICLHKCYIKLNNINHLETTMIEHMRKIHNIIIYLERFGARGKGGVKIYEPRVYNSDDENTDIYSESLPESSRCVNYTLADYRKEINNAIRLCLFGCFNALMRLRAFPFITFFEVAKASCAYFIHYGLLNEFFDVISLLSFALNVDCEGKREFLGDLLAHLSSHPKCTRKLSFYTLEIASDDSLDSNVSLHACKLVGKKLGINSWLNPSPLGWHEIQYRILEIAYEAATSLGLWDQANHITWSMLSLSSYLSNPQIGSKILHGLETTSILSLNSNSIRGSEISNILALKSIKINPNRNKTPGDFQLCNSKIVNNSSISGNNYRIIRYHNINIHTHKLRMTIIGFKLIKNPALDFPSSSVFHVLSNKPATILDSIDYRISLGDRDNWEVGRDEFVTITILNKIKIPITAKSLQLVTLDVDCALAPITMDLEPGFNTFIQSITPLNSGRLHITGVRLTIANKTFDFALPGNIVILVKPHHDIHSNVELLPISASDFIQICPKRLYSGSISLVNPCRPMPMLYISYKRIKHCTCMEHDPCSKLCWYIISKTMDKSNYNEILYEGEYRLGHLVVYNMSNTPITDIKVSYGINDWRSSRLNSNPLVFLPLKCRILPSYSNETDDISGRILYSDRFNNSSDSSRLNINSFNSRFSDLYRRLSISSEASKSIESARAIGSITELYSGFKVIIPFIFQASSLASNLPIRISWNYKNDSSITPETSFKLKGKIGYNNQNYIETEITSTVKHPIAVASNSFEIYPIIHLDLKLAIDASLAKIKSIRPYFISEFDNPFVNIRLRLKNTLDSDIYFINGKDEIKLISNKIKSVCISTCRVPRNANSILEYIDDKIRLSWRLGERSGRLHLSRLIKLITKKNLILTTTFTIKKRGLNTWNMVKKKKILQKYVPHMAVWRRGVYTKKGLVDTRVVMNLDNSDIIYQSPIRLLVKPDDEVMANRTFNIKVKIDCCEYEKIDGWVFAIPYDANGNSFVENGLASKLDSSIFCSGLMEQIVELDNQKGSFKFKFIAIRPGEYKIAVGLVLSNLNKVIWHHKPIIITVLD